MSRALAALALAGAVVAVAGCGGSSSATAPAEDPGRVMTAVIRHELEGQLGLSYQLLVRQQRDAVPAKLYANCPSGPRLRRRDVDVDILGVRDEVYTVPALGRTRTKAVSYRMIVRAGGDGQRIVDTGHLVAQDGHWRWTLSASTYDSLSRGFCP